MNVKENNKKTIRRKRRTRLKIKGTSNRPRLCVFKSLKHIYAQIIDDTKREILVSAKDLEIKTKTDKQKGSKNAEAVGRLIAEKAKDKKIEKVVFDRGAYKYQGKIKILAESAKKNGLVF